MLSKLEPNLIARQFNLTMAHRCRRKQTTQFKDGLARQDQFLTRQGRFTFKRHAGVSEAMAIGCNGTQFITINQKQQTVQVIANILCGHRKLCLSEQMAKLFLRYHDLLRYRLQTRPFAENLLLVRVCRLNRLFPALTCKRFSSRFRLTSALSGKERRISCSLRAPTVTAPLPSVDR